MAPTLNYKEKKHDKSTHGNQWIHAWSRPQWPHYYNDGATRPYSV